MTRDRGHRDRRLAALVLAGAVALVVMLGASPAIAATFDPNLILADSNLRDVNSMNEAQIQAFLDKQPGLLGSLTTPDHNGTPKRVSKIIYEACQEFRINPKVMLVMLQKENSLLTNPSPTPRVLSRAVGAGCPNSIDNRYPGFGNQIWNGARLLDGYGEGKTTTYIPMWKPGMTRDVAEGSVTPKNLATFKLFVYNPVIGAKSPYGDLSAQKGSTSGNANFWLIYWRYFGDPLLAPQAQAPAPAPAPQPAPAPEPAPAAEPEPADDEAAKPKTSSGTPLGLRMPELPRWRELHSSTPTLSRGFGL